MEKPFRETFIAFPSFCLRDLAARACAIAPSAPPKTADSPECRPPAVGLPESVTPSAAPAEPFPASFFRPVFNCKYHKTYLRCKSNRIHEKYSVFNGLYPFRTFSGEQLAGIGKTDTLRTGQVKRAVLPIRRNRFLLTTLSTHDNIIGLVALERWPSG